MTKSKLSLKNLVKCGLLLNICLIIACLILGCSSSTKPTYLKENITEAIQNICKKEYKIDVKAKLVGQTLWLYMPVEDLFTALGKNDKPEKYVERFTIENNKDEFQNGTLALQYNIKRVIPEQEKHEEFKTNKAVFEKMNDVLMVLRRVILSMDRSKASEPKFYCLVVGDIKNGFELRQTIYYSDLRKVSYGLIAIGEYQHRAIQDLNVVPEVIKDKDGLYLNYKDITLAEFIRGQIQHRIKLKFNKPEVDKNVDIDKEIIKIAIHTIKIYDFKDFGAVEFNNLLTNNKITLNRQAIWARTAEQKF